MKRIDFLKSILLGYALFFVSGKSPGNTPQKPREMRLCSPYIAGYQYYDGMELEGKLTENDGLILKRQSENPFDRYAVEIFSNSTKLGYLPRDENRTVARLMDQGAEVKAQIEKILPGYDTYRKIRVKVYIEEIIRTSK